MTVINPQEIKNIILRSILIGLCVVFVLTYTYGQAPKDVTKKQLFIDSLLEQMTLEEKVGQMNQYSGFYDVTGPVPTEGNNAAKYEHIKSGLVGSMLNVAGVENVRKLQELAVENSRLGIPMIFGYDVIHGYKTIMPIPLAEAASWDLDAIKRSAVISAKEAAAAGINWTFAPMVDISRDARWGRVMEGAGEDPFLGSKIAEVRIHGFQGNDLADPLSVASCAKHFAAYGFAESGREYNTADIGSSTLYNIVLPPFKSSVNAGVQTVMNSFNELNGIPATGDSFLQRNILKGQWGFEGFIVSDWGTIGEMTTHGFAEDDSDASRIAANAGCDMDMESHLYIEYLKSLVEQSAVSIKLVDEAVKRILSVKYNLGLFDDPYRYCDLNREKRLLGHQEHLDVALDVAKKSIVLLKNENDLLPLPKSGKKIAVIGHLASEKNSPLGNWRIGADEQSAVSVLEGLNAYSGNEINHETGVRLFEGLEHFAMELKINETDRTGMKEAIELAAHSELVIMVLGEHGLQSGESRSRSKLGLPGLQQELLEAVYAVNPNIVLVLMNGRPLAIEWADENIPAIVEAWQLGSQSGHAIAQVLYGDYNPSGKLPMTFPRSEGQVPIYYNYKMTGRPGPNHDVFWSHYTDVTNVPLYPFGYGLSYTTFEYSDLNVNTQMNQSVQASVLVSNIGEREGEEVVQLYIRDKVASVKRPVAELKGFKKIHLDKGESRRVSFRLTADELGYYNNQGHFIFEPGEFQIKIANLEQSIHILDTSSGSNE